MMHLVVASILQGWVARRSKREAIANEIFMNTKIQYLACDLEAKFLSSDQIEFNDRLIDICTSRFETQMHSDGLRRSYNL